MEKEQLKPILEAVIMASSNPMTLEALLSVFPEIEQPEKDLLKESLEEMIAECEGRSFELKLVSSGYRYQVRKDYAEYVNRLLEEKPARYSRALLETLALIAYRQPITRGEIEAVRGVSVSSHLIKTLHERDWIKVVGHRDVPGKPSLYATTKEFLDYFNLANLDELPSLQDIRDIDQINAELDLRIPEAENDADANAANKTDSAEAESGETNSDAEASTETETVSEEAASDNEEANSQITLETADETESAESEEETEASQETRAESDDEQEEEAVVASVESDVDAENEESYKATSASAET